VLFAENDVPCGTKGHTLYLGHQYTIVYGRRYVCFAQHSTEVVEASSSLTSRTSAIVRPIQSAMRRTIIRRSDGAKVIELAYHADEPKKA